MIPIQISLTFVPSIPIDRLGDSLSHYLNQCWPDSPMHICGTRGDELAHWSWINTILQTTFSQSTLVLSFYIDVVKTLSIRMHFPLHWRHNDHDGVSNHQPHHCLLNRLFSRRSRKTSKHRVTGLCAGNSPGPVTSPHKGPVTRKMFPFDDVIMLMVLNRWQVIIWNNDVLIYWRLYASLGLSV